MVRKMELNIWLHTNKIKKNNFLDVTNDLKTLEINNIFLLTLSSNGKAFFDTDLRLRESMEIPYGDIIDSLHDEGLRIHAWFCVFILNNYELINSEWRHCVVVNRLGDSVLKKPVWGIQYWICPTCEEYHEHFLSLIREFLRKYKVDGIHLDYIRYPDRCLPKRILKRYVKKPEIKIYEEEDYCYCERCLRKADSEGINAFRDKEEYEEWRRIQILKMVEKIRSITKGLQLSSAVFPNLEWAKKFVLQDWSKSSKFMDKIALMGYYYYYQEPPEWSIAQYFDAIRIISEEKVSLGIGPILYIKSQELKKLLAKCAEKNVKSVTIFEYFQLTNEHKNVIHEVLKTTL